MTVTTKQTAGKKNNRKQPKPRRAPARWPETHTDPWADWKPQWTPAGGDVHSQQEKHSPTGDVTLRMTAARDETVCRRRITDARLWDAMTPPQQDAALAVAAAYESMSRGLGFATSDWTRIARGQGQPGDGAGRRVHRYIDWTRACHAENISHSMIIDILVFGFSCRALDRDRRVPAGAARRNLLDGLTLYARLQGWVR